MPNVTREPLAERASRALFRCFKETGRVPSAISYRTWRDTIPVEDRRDIPSSSAIVPYVWSSWNDARAAAGISEWRAGETFNGPRPRWTREQCMEWVVKWLNADSGSSLTTFTAWIDGLREAGEPAPSVSTIRLRLGMPWSMIMAEAQEHRSV
jgi:hypothetical protein